MRRDIALQTEDGTSLRGWHYVPERRSGRVPTIVMAHGFPESWYSWRHQMAPLAAAGFTACAIDVRGYGGSDKPHPVEAYAMTEMTADVAGVIDALSPGKPAVIVGHDWGAPIVWHTALMHPRHVRAVAGLSVPWFGLPPMSLDQLIKAMYTDQGKFFYQAYFKDEGVAEAAFGGCRQQFRRGLAGLLLGAVEVGLEGHRGLRSSGEPSVGQ